ncbi:MAG: undecaprenyldiphospho-muramoylpentapeptide beta-N-acetylglucosaminyltransferase [Aerococcus suis]|nr:undecaprenyldiphospho-muramoylpentapeptide beta-N-acetylglucosaminyltransferase [Aerococcus suis]MDY4646126.1 undecaprenyldiphospho-muramoylpentapeptide beta-N-acetylglucosaminyltransferase [Aerococcus suis]
MRVVLSGGGTGGHIYPALALQKQIKEKYPDAEFLYIGIARGLEAKIVPEAGLRFETITIQGLKRSFSWDNMKLFSMMHKAIKDSKRLIREFNPDVVIGTGGYVCAPVLYAASRLHIPTVIHEQNSVAGITNKFLSRFVNKIGIAFERVKKDFGKNQYKVVMTGNPRAQEVAKVNTQADLEAFGLQNGKRTVLIFGGSGGAQKINQTLEQLIPKFVTRDYQVLIASGARYYEEFKNAFSDFNEWKNVQVVDYIANMPELFNTIDLVVCRSGATTLTELTALGTPSILIPSPNVTENHQEYNARSLTDHQAAEMIVEDDLTSERLLETIDRLMADDTLRQEMSVQSKKLGYPNAGDLLIDVIESVLKS